LLNYYAKILNIHTYVYKIYFFKNGAIDLKNSKNIQEKKEKEFRSWLSTPHYDDKDFLESINRCIKGVEILKTNEYKDKYTFWTCYNTLAKSYLQIKEYEKAIKYARISNWYASDDSFERIDNMDVLARCYSLKGKEDIAEKCFNKCYQLYKNRGNKRGMARILTNKANYMNRENKEKILLEAKDLYEELFKSKLVNEYTLECSYFNLYEYFIEQGNIDRAIEYHSKILSLNLLDFIENSKKINNLQQTK
jgi:tetratricopeptide (TPR) repeat protein